MTTVHLTKYADGRFCSCSAEGHAGFAARGYDIVCAAITMLLRTTAQSLQSAGIAIEAEAVVRGEFAFRANGFESSDHQKRLIYAADFLQTGIQLLTVEYPNYVSLSEKTIV